MSLRTTGSTLKKHQASGGLTMKWGQWCKLNDKFGVYVARLGNAISVTMKQYNHATLQGKHYKLTKANILLCSTFLFNLLLPAKTLILTIQKENTDIITIVNLARIINIARKLEKIYSLPHPETISEQLPTLKDVLSNIEDQNCYQGATLKNVECKKEYLQRNILYII